MLPTLPVDLVADAALKRISPGRSLVKQEEPRDSGTPTSTGGPPEQTKRATMPYSNALLIGATARRLECGLGECGVKVKYRGPRRVALVICIDPHDRKRGRHHRKAGVVPLLLQKTDADHPPD